MIRTSLLLALATASLLCADQVTLKNGDRLTGKILRSDAKTLTLKTDYAGEITIDRAAIVSLSTDEAVSVQLKDKTVTGTVAPAPDLSVDVKTTAGATLRAPLADVLAFRTPAEQKAWEREQERLHHARLNDFWSGFVSLNLAGASGNAKTQSFATSAAASRQAGKNKMSLYFNQVYSTQSTVAPAGPTANRISGGYRLDRDVRPRLFVFGTTDFDYDKFLLLDLRSVLGGGLGYHAWKSSRGYWDLGAGGVWNREKFREGTIRKSGEILINEESAHTLLARLKLYQKASFFPNLSETGAYRFNFDGGASLPLYKWLEWNIGLSDRFLSNPIGGRKKNDILYTTGIRFSFDQTRR
jgi:putative salt-induced outer membrane protein